MDPLTKACSEYDAYLREGGEPVDLKALGFNTVSQRTKTRKLHPSSLGPGLCDRKACYNVACDVGDIERDIPETPEDNLGHRIGFIFQDYVAQTLAFKGALIDMEIPLEDEYWTGRADLLVDPCKLDVTDSRPTTKAPWLVDVKTVKGYTVDDRYPKTYHIAQLERYRSMMTQPTVPILFYVTRIDFQTAMYSWKFDGYDCTLLSDGKPSKIFDNLNYDIDASAMMQERWLVDGTLPDRCAGTPDGHFMCASYQKGGPDRGKYKVNCPFFARCWELPLPEGLVFDKGAFSKDDDDNQYLPF